MSQALEASVSRRLLENRGITEKVMNRLAMVLPQMRNKDGNIRVRDVVTKLVKAGFPAMTVQATIYKYTQPSVENPGWRVAELLPYTPKRIGRPPRKVLQETPMTDEVQPVKRRQRARKTPHPSPARDLIISEMQQLLRSGKYGGTQRADLIDSRGIIITMMNTTHRGHGQLYRALRYIADHEGHGRWKLKNTVPEVKELPGVSSEATTHADPYVGDAPALATSSLSESCQALMDLERVIMVLRTGPLASSLRQIVDNLLN